VSTYKSGGATYGIDESGRRVPEDCRLQAPEVLFVQFAIRRFSGVRKITSFRFCRWHVSCALSGTADSEGAKFMADLLLIVATVLFFIVAWLYVAGCDRL
jgi:hypothetical protein